jgi:Fic family protein
VYIYQHPDWPNFTWHSDALTSALGHVRHQQGLLFGQMQALGFNLRREATLATLTEDVVKSSEIEGEKLGHREVRSSIARRLGMDAGGLRAVDRKVEGVVEMMLDASHHFDQPLTERRLFRWHSSLFPPGGTGMRKIRVGQWRNDKRGPMQVVSGAAGRERVHFEAPPAARLAREMAAFLSWFNAGPETDAVLKAGVAHLWFVTVHPFDDGNGRIARAIADLCLARSERSSQRFYSMSSQIQQERAAYYAMLEETQKGGLDVTPWLLWFLGCLGRAIDNAGTLLASVLAKARFWAAVGDAPINERQRRMLNRLLDGLDGQLTTTRWAKLARCSPDTALRDILELVQRGILIRSKQGGRSTSYTLALRGTVS